MTSPLDRELALAILQYLSKNPEAMDSMEGIARFWIIRQRIEAHVGDVEGALQYLVDEGFLQVREAAGASHNKSRQLYSLNANRRAEVRALLDKKTD